MAKKIISKVLLFSLMGVLLVAAGPSEAKATKRKLVKIRGQVYEDVFVENLAEGSALVIPVDKNVRIKFKEIPRDFKFVSFDDAKKQKIRKKGKATLRIKTKSTTGTQVVKAQLFPRNKTEDLPEPDFLKLILYDSRTCTEEEFVPVCGEHVFESQAGPTTFSKTYSNTCEAERVGATNIIPGECPPQGLELFTGSNVITVRPPPSTSTIFLSDCPFTDCTSAALDVQKTSGPSGFIGICASGKRQRFSSFQRFILSSGSSCGTSVQFQTTSGGTANLQFSFSP